nr:lytic transglycosylase domain-containing protein [Trinickia mobilis]
MVELLQRCAPNVALSTMSSIVKVESRGNMYALADAGPVNLPWSVRKNLVRSFYPATLEEASGLARSLIAQGHTVSLGLSQVNDRNLKRMGLTIEQVFDPCTNIATGARILTDFYDRASKQYGAGERALQAAISAYNSGDFERGIENGYVGLVYAAAGAVPTLSAGAALRASTGGRGKKRQQSPANTWWASRAELLKQARESPLSDVATTTE